MSHAMRKLLFWTLDQLGRPATNDSLRLGTQFILLEVDRKYYLVAKVNAV